LPLPPDTQGDATVGSGGGCAPMLLPMRLRSFLIAVNAS